MNSKIVRNTETCNRQ